MDRIGAVILAAGMSRRMGSPKGLLRIGDTTVIERIVATVSAAGAARVVVVTGHEPQRMRDALRSDRAAFAHNPNFESGGMLSSVQAGVAVIQDRCDAFFLMLLDQPLVTARTLTSMAAHRSRSGRRIVMPAYNGEHGHPLLIDASYVPEICALEGDATLHTFVERHRSEIDVLEVEDAGVITDLDTPEDYGALKDRLIR